MQTAGAASTHVRYLPVDHIQPEFDRETDDHTGYEPCAIECGHSPHETNRSTVNACRDRRIAAWMQPPFRHRVTLDHRKAASGAMKCARSVHADASTGWCRLWNVDPYSRITAASKIY